MELGTIIALSSLSVAAAVALLNFIRWLQEQRISRDKKLKEAIKSEVEKDSPYWRNAESAMSVMEKLLDISITSEEKLQKQLETYRAENDKLRARVRELENS